MAPGALGLAAGLGLATIAVSDALADPDGCELIGGTYYCEGDQSNGLTGGVEFPTSATSVVIEDTGPITPQTGKAGLFFIADTSATVDSQANVTTTGGGDGFYIQAPGTVELFSDGDITSNGQRGIFALSTASNVTVESRGDIWALQEGIYAQGAGPVVVTNRGNVFSQNLKGIFGLSSGSSVTIDSKGAISAEDEAIFAQGAGDVTVASKGDITSDSLKGIFANSFGGNTSVTSKGDVFAQDEAIFAQGPGNVRVVSSGDITSTNLKGIFANAHIPGNNGTVYVESNGDIHAHDEAIFAQGPNTVEVYSDGDVTSDNQRGIYALSQYQTVYVKSRGDVSANREAIFAQGDQGVTVDSVGDINSTIHRGIFTSSNNGPITIDSVGNVTALLDGIFANGRYDVEINSQGDILSTSIASGRGIFGSSASGRTDVTSDGDVTAALDAIFAEGYGVSVFSRGDLTSYAARGIFAEGRSGTSVVDTAGDIDAWTDGIWARGATSVTLTNDGDVTSAIGRGILAESTGGPVTFYSMGDITSNAGTPQEAIFARAGGSLDFTSMGDIHSESFRGAFIESTGGNVDVDIEGNVTAEFEGVFVSGPGDVTVDIRGDVTSNEWRGILVSRALSGGSPSGMINLTYGGGTVQSLGGDDLKQPHAIEVDADGGSSLVTILDDGTVTGGSNATTGPNYAYGVLFGAGTNHLVNWGEINEDNGGRALGGINGGDDTIDNYGLVIGSSFMGGGTNVFNNMEGGLYESGATIDLGAGNDFNNSGVLSPFGTGTSGTTTLTGDFIQSSTGTFLVDVPFTLLPSDLLSVPGATDQVVVDGFVAAYIPDLDTAGPLTGITVIDNTGGLGVTDNGITGADQGPIQVTVSTTPFTVDIDVALDFGFAGLSGNQATLGDFFQTQFLNLVGGYSQDQEDFFLALANVGDTAAYENALDTLSPEYATAAIDAAFAAAQGFGNNLFSCSVREGDNRFIAQNSCGWGAVGGRFSNRDGTGGSLDAEDRAATVAAGIQYTRDAWSFGFGAGYEHGKTESASTDLDRDQINVGLVAKHRMNAFELAAAFVGGGGAIDSSRAVGPDIAEGNRDFYYVGGIARATYVHEMGNAYLKPILEGAATYVSADGYTETGAGVANLSVDSSEDLVGRGSAMLEIGTEFSGGNGVLVRPFVGGGVTVLAGADTEVTASFPGLSSDTITLTTDNDDIYGDVKAGVQVLGGAGWTGRLQYDGHFSGNTQQHGGSAKLSIPF